jgi:hypothetical protein
MPEPKSWKGKMESIVARDVSRKVADQWGKECAEIADKDREKKEKERLRDNPGNKSPTPPRTVLVPQSIAVIFDKKGTMPLEYAKNMLIKCGATADKVLADI